MQGLTRYDVPGIDAGLFPFSVNFSSELVADTTSYNVTPSLVEGVGPRFGMLVVPGHGQRQAIVSGGITQPGGLALAEEVGSTFYENRRKVFGIIPFSFSLPTQKQYYSWILVNSSNVLSPNYSASNANTFDAFGNNILSPKADIAYGFNKHYESSQRNTIYRLLGGTIASVSTITARNKAQSTAYIMQSRSFPAKNLLMAIDPAKLPDADSAGGGGFSYFGKPDSFWDLSMGKNARSITVFTLSPGTGSRLLLNKQYIYANATPTDEVVYLSKKPTSFPSTVTDVDFTQLNGASQLARIDGTTPAANPTYQIVKDDNLVINSSGTIVFTAAGKACGTIIKEKTRDESDNPCQFFDPTVISHAPRIRRTGGLPPTGATFYRENLVEKQTGFARFPSWDGITPLSTLAFLASSGAGFIDNFDFQVVTGAAGSGVLFKNTDYELTYSVFDKSTGVESNVAEHVRFRTGADDLVYVTVRRTPKTAGGVSYQETPDAKGILDPADFKRHNLLEIRFYYRELGALEWLPGLIVDATSFFFDPTIDEFRCAESAIGALPGAYPGGFNDYSPLPNDDWTSVFTYQGRVFWMSQKQMIFSYKNNPFCYPLRNSSSLAQGFFKGGIVHAYPGQANQSSRVVIFGSEETYIGNFRGQEYSLTVPVTLGPDTTAEFPLEGSDFVIDTWTSVTAFSSASACIADGLLYWWGPQGIYRDVGNEIPEKISGHLEPWIFGIYDNSTVDDIHCTYSEQTKEIIWFYNKPSETKSYGLVYNTRLDEFYQYKFDCKIDWSQKITIQNGDTGRNSAGNRTIIGVRDSSAASIQRAYFFDHKCRYGDVKPTSEFMVRDVTNAGATLNFGANCNDTAAFSIGNIVTIASQEFDGPASFQAEVTGVAPNSINIKTGGVVNAALTSDKNYQVFPTSSAIAWTLDTTYWMPTTLADWWRFHYQHTMFKIRLLPKYLTNGVSTPSQSLSIGYRSNVAGALQSRTVNLVDNSDGHAQIHSQLTRATGAAEGQALRFSISGSHNGNEWALQRMGVYCAPLADNNLRVFEG